MGGVDLRCAPDSWGLDWLAFRSVSDSLIARQVERQAISAERRRPYNAWWWLRRGDGWYARGFAHAPLTARGRAGGGGGGGSRGRGRGGSERGDQRGGLAEGGRAGGGVAERLLDGGYSSPQRGDVH